MDELLKVISMMEDAPPVPRGLKASLKVPYDRTYRQWDTRGRLWIWVNRAALYDAIGPRVAKNPGAFNLLMGIDVFHVD